MPVVTVAICLPHSELGRLVEAVCRALQYTTTRKNSWPEIEHLLAQSPCSCVVAPFGAEADTQVRDFEGMWEGHAVALVLYVDRASVQFDAFASLLRAAPEGLLHLVDARDGNGAGLERALRAAVAVGVRAAVGIELGRIIIGRLELPPATVAARAILAVAQAEGRIHSVPQVVETLHVSKETLRLLFRLEGLQISTGKIIDWVNLLYRLYLQERLCLASARRSLANGSSPHNFRRHVLNLTGMSVREVSAEGFLTALERFARACGKGGRRSSLASLHGLMER